MVFGFNSNVASAQDVYTYTYKGYEIYVDDESVNGYIDDFTCRVGLKNLESGEFSHEKIRYITNDDIIAVDESGEKFSVHPMSHPPLWAVYMKAITYLHKNLSKT